jgi:YfiR/HmsC-like
MKRLICFSLLLFCAFGLPGQNNYQTYTLYIYNFAKMIQWPEEERKGDFEILVLGDSPVLKELEKMAEKKKLGERIIKVTKIKSIAEFTKAHILFLSTDQSGQLGAVLGKLGGTTTLLISDQPGLGAKGSDINFIVREGKLAFELNQNAIGKHKLKSAAELNKLAILI